MEIVIALGIFVFVITAVLGLLPVALKANNTSVEESRAINIISQVVVDLKAKTSTTNTPTFYLPTVSSLPTGITQYPDFYVDEAHRRVPRENARYSVSLRYARPTGNSGLPIGVGIRVGWPPGIGANPPGNFVETYICIGADL